MATAKTNAVRARRLGVRYELREYEVDPDDLAAETVARKVGMPAEQVFKTLVARGDKHGVCLAVVPGNCELDLKALARATGDKKIDTVPLKEVEPLTGYIRGGVTALACKKAYPVYLDETAQLVRRDLDLGGHAGPPDPARPRRLHPGRGRQGRPDRQGQRVAGGQSLGLLPVLVRGRSRCRETARIAPQPSHLGIGPGTQISKCTPPRNRHPNEFDARFCGWRQLSLQHDRHALAQT